MDWTIYNNTTPWGLLSSEQKMALKKHKTGGTRFRAGTDDGLDYTGWSYKDLEYFGVDTSWWYKFERYYKGWGFYEWSVSEPGDSSVIRATGPYEKADPPPKPREFFIVMDHGKLIGYFDDYPVALQHYEIIKVKEQF